MKKGFFFVVVTFLILTYILTSISSWTMAIETSEKRFSERFRTANIETIIEQIDEENLNEVAEINANYALQELSEYSVDYPVKEGSADEYQHIRESMEGLVIHGKAEGGNFTGGGALLLPEGSSMYDWAEKLNTTINKIGFEVSNFSAMKFYIEQIDERTIEYSFDVHLEIKERIGKTSVSRDYNITGEIDIEGMTDPMAKRDAKEHGIENLTKQFFFNNNYNETDDMQPESITRGDEGQGWFYGPVVDVSDAGDVPMINRSLYILVGTYDQIKGLSGADLSWTHFGAYILTNNPQDAGGDPDCPDQSKTFKPLYYGPACVPRIERGEDDINKSFMVKKGFKPTKPILFVAGYSSDNIDDNPEHKIEDVEVYDIEKFRDFVMCGYYVHSENAPSFFQRMLEDSEQRNDSALGIESFLVGRFIGGSEQGAAKYDDDLSRLDRELFNDIDGERMMGMPGCKNRNMCNKDSILGHFRMSDEAVGYYELDDMVCTEDQCG